ncbi:hypothetical protein LVJ94_11300 [Pendulispora rubella]|uniref:Lipoprotein n=1 Tax=Pendulispora rubella TaxID=2741070 RepID=A0ABZ2LAM5_9BACT
MPIHPSRSKARFVCVASGSLAVTVVMALMFGCTFLATFDDPPPREVHCAGYKADPAAQPCSFQRGRGAGTYCACDGLVRNYQASANDLVTCSNDGTIVEVTSCAQGCAIYPSPLPGTCDPCPGRADGTWCARELGVDAGRTMMTCRRGKQEPGSSLDCPTACGGTGPAAECR